jgi:predicted RNA-binding Zn-ribbon protein involved in translation (DUF1610 family)
MTMSAQTAEMRLDGNALGGQLLAVFGVEMTVAMATCASCGTRGALAEVEVYVHCPGTVARCPACGSVLMRVVESSTRTWISFDGIRTLELPLNVDA